MRRSSHPQTPYDTAGRERKGKEESEICNSIIVLGGENQKKEVRPVILSLFFGGEADTETKKRK